MFLNLFYDFCKNLARLVLNIFYPNTKISNPERLDFDSPCILVTNHPNTLLDPLHAASRTKKRANFVVNAGLYRSTFGNWFFSTFYCVPVERAHDKSGRNFDNSKTLDRCNKFIQDGGCLFIAPQGLSEIKRNIGKLKTGVARIALGAEAAGGWKTGVEILPFGLNYESPQHFRTDMFVNIGEPLTLTKYQALYEEDQYKAVKQLTGDLQAAMEALIPNTTEEEDVFVKIIEQIQQNQHPLALDMAFYRTKKFVNYLHTVDTEVYQDIETKTHAYRVVLECNDIDDKAVKSASEQKSVLQYMLFGILGFPLFLYGVINNLLTVGVPTLIVKSLKLIENYDSNVKAMTGMFLWPVFYYVQMRLVYSLTSNWWATILYGVSIYLSMVLAWKYKEGFQDFRKLMRAKKVVKGSDILEKRKQVIELIPN